MGAEISENLIILFRGTKKVIPIQKKGDSIDETMRRQAKEAGVNFIMVNLAVSITATILAVTMLFESKGVNAQIASRCATIIVSVGAQLAVSAVFGIASFLDFCKSVLTNVLSLGKGSRLFSDVLTMIDNLSQGITWYIERKESEDPPKPSEPEDSPPIFDPRDFEDDFEDMKNTVSPIALDLDGDGMEFVKDGAYFDYDASGFAEKATWLAKDDGLLVLDRNGDGVINDGSELFGTSTRKKDNSLAHDGFEALAEYDLNKDGKIDAGITDSYVATFKNDCICRSVYSFVADRSYCVER